MTSLYVNTELPASALGQLRGDNLVMEGSKILWRGREFPLSEEALQDVRRWLRLRERLRTLAEERSRHRKTDAWAESEFLFPNSRRGPSGYGVIWRTVLHPRAWLSASRGSPGLLTHPGSLPATACAATIRAACPKLWGRQP
jgi:integrase